ncbi:MAG: YodL domain-containing protein [bacterium]
MKNIGIYQINLKNVTEADNSMRFRIFEELPDDQDTVDLIAEGYELVWGTYFNYDALSAVESALPQTDSLRDIDILSTMFNIFNIKHPDNYQARSLSVSDIVSIDNNFYHCQAGGWKKIKVEGFEEVLEKAQSKNNN